LYAVPQLGVTLVDGGTAGDTGGGDLIGDLGRTLDDLGGTVADTLGGPGP